MNETCRKNSVDSLSQYKCVTSVIVLPGWIHQCAAGRETGPVPISTSQHAFCQNFSLTQHWTEPRLLPGAYTHSLVFAHQTRNIASLALHALSVCLRQVLDVCPLPGMVVSPAEGVVPSGGKAALKIHFNPDSVIKFDARVEVRNKEEKRESCLLGCYDDFSMSVCVYVRNKKKRN